MSIVLETFGQLSVGHHSAPRQTSERLRRRTLCGCPKVRVASISVEFRAVERSV